ncbi:HAD-IC family P-type ATPase [Texas Phoenix palm phytoplasma]|uniref:HAD-IC family P-type ATPase n=1 Tax=Texas Phoenix palm phytoplasma TaxID=176709 RepID=A0ABS5BIH2_9MOLU|nr:cation-transporting P-type ATPase [Texas Phoenix palm phytoplasma]MBP3059377.1 HAD-IC family P-type ATPase [Texas Phoenix palm phytoplasma]
MKKKDIFEISSFSKEKIFKYFNTSFEGLKTEEVKKRQILYGFNIIKKSRNFSFIKKFIKQFTSLFAILLWVSGFLAFLIEENAVSISIISVVIVNGIFSFFQEHKADKILSSLSEMIPKKIQVYRDGEIKIIDVTDLTIGDLIFLEVGVTIPADAVLIEANNFFVDNSILTGETIPLNRNVIPNNKKTKVISEISNLVYAGTTVSQGSAKAIVYDIGKNTQIGEVSNLSQNINKGINTLEKEIHKVIKIISCIAIILSSIVFFICLWRFYDSEVSWNKILIPSVVVALGMLVANIPEGLLPTINLSLAIGSQRMAKHKALIKQLFSVETLNSATVICTDKTGTLTKNQLTCNKIIFPNGMIKITGNGFQKEGKILNFNNIKCNKIINKIFIAAVMCSEANLIDDLKNKKYFKIVGNPTEGSLLIASFKYGLDINKIRNSFVTEKINPFSSETKKMSVLVNNISQKNYDIGSKYLFVKGAPNVLLEKCNAQYKDGKVTNFSKKEKEIFSFKNEELSKQGYRILAIAYKKIEQKDFKEEDMVFLGFAVNYDPPKIEVRDAVKKLLNAGLKITVITGDYGPTAISIGKQVGIIKDDYLNIDGITLDKMSFEELKKILKTKKPIFFSRTTPKHKLKIVEAYRSNKEVVGVIGDGVNDILAMKAAHIGIAMGKSGKDVAHNAADMILLDDNFSTIPKAVLEARGIYDNVKKFMTYVFCSNIPQIFPIIFMAFFRVPLYLTVMQILAIDLITDLIPAIALGAEKPKINLLNKKPITEKDHLLDFQLLKRSYGFLGMVEGITTLVFFLYFGGLKLYQQEIPFKQMSHMAEFKLASTMAFGSVIFSQIGNVFACRSDQLYFWQTIKQKNKLLYFGIFCEIFLFVLISQSFDTLNNFFGTQKIRFNDYIILSCCIFVMLFFDTIYKFFSKNKINNKE